MSDHLVAGRAAAIIAEDIAPSDPTAFIETAVAAFEVQRGFVTRARCMPFPEAARLLMIARHAPKPEFMTEALLLALLAELQEVPA